MSNNQKFKSYQVRQINYIINELKDVAEKEDEMSLVQLRHQIYSLGTLLYRAVNDRPSPLHWDFPGLNHKDRVATTTTKWVFIPVQLGDLVLVGFPSPPLKE